MGGLRPWLGKYGVTFGADRNQRISRQPRGGLNTGGTYDGLTTATVQVDTQKAFGLPGGLFNVSALQIHGRNLSADKLGTLNTASGIEAEDTTRLWELWYQQSFLNKRVDVKVGQQSLDQEFIGQPECWRCSSIRCSAGRRCPRTTCRRAVRLIRCPTSACACAARSRRR